MTADLGMMWSGDLVVSPTGDLEMVNGPALGTERVLRRLMTNPGDYIWNPTYGAGLAQFVGQPIDPASVQALILSQMELETAVSHAPEPVVAIQSDVVGRLYAQIRYLDSETASATALNINIPE